MHPYIHPSSQPVSLGRFERGPATRNRTGIQHLPYPLRSNIRSNSAATGRVKKGRYIYNFQTDVTPMYGWLLFSE